MKPRFTLYRRAGIFYCQDSETGKQSSLRTRDESKANTILHAKNEAYRQPSINRQITCAYLRKLPQRVTGPERKQRRPSKHQVQIPGQIFFARSFHCVFARQHVTRALAPNFPLLGSTHRTSRTIRDSEIP
jgi:hypothetical protein